MNVMDVVDVIAERCKANNFAVEGDFRGSDGLLRCGVCKDLKEVKIDCGASERVVPCLCRCGVEARERQKKIVMQRQIDEMRMGWLKGYESMTFANSVGNPSMGFAERYVAKWDDVLQSRLSFTLSGGVGCGKTYAAACIANAILDKGYRVWMATTSAMLDLMFNEPEKVKNRLRTFDLVVIDDFGAERNTEYAGEKMFQIIDERIRANLPTLITTNLDITQPASNLTYGRIFSRLSEFAPQSRCKGEDMRAMRGNENRRLAFELLRGE